MEKTHSGGHDKGFTLIELLIVVAIIAILAAIAMPNFLDAQVRSKVARVRSDQRSLSTAIESYAVDNTKYPPDYRDTGESDHRRLVLRLTTPVAYITRIPPDPFTQHIPNPDGMGNHIETYWYFRFDNNRDADTPNLNGAINGFTWAVESAGPSGYLLHPSGSGVLVTARTILSGFEDCIVYDPTNGSISYGHILRTNKGDFVGAHYNPMP